MLLIDHIGKLLTLAVTSSSSHEDGEIADAAILIDGERIFWVGPAADLPNTSVDQQVDAGGCLVMPGLIDCHSHLIFAGNRADEFARRMNQESYQAIMAKGGGIMATVNATRQKSDEELIALAKARADKILSSGVTTLEVKSGYGLNSHDELRILRLIKRLNHTHDLDFHATFLGAHVVPPEYVKDRTKYVDLVVNDMLEHIAAEQLAIDCDVFCEEGAFSPTEAKRILATAHSLGFGLRAHVQQLSHSGGIGLLRDLPIRSISHADFLSVSDIVVIAESGAVVEALPFAGLFLRSQTITPVAQLRSANVSLAIATDFNPGSAMCHDLVLAARLGVTYYGFSLDEAIRGITVNGALALGRNDIGIIKPGNLADILITNCYSLNEVFYDWTKHPAHQVIKRGKIA